MSEGPREPDDLSAFCCQNPDCPDHGQRGHGNLTACGHYGPQPLRLLDCRTCEARFSQRKGTARFDTRLPPDKVLGVRKTSRLTGVNKDTVSRYALLAGGHAQTPHDERVAFSPRHARGPVRRAVGVRRQEGEALRPRRPRRRHPR